jgi:hypothetical protein
MTKFSSHQSNRNGRCWPELQRACHQFLEQQRGESVEFAAERADMSLECGPARQTKVAGGAERDRRTCSLRPARRRFIIV